MQKKEIPNLVKVLPLGYICTDYGKFYVDQESYTNIKNHMLKRKIDVVIDYEHQTLKNVQAPASGWAKEFVLKEDGIYARVEWTEKALSYLANKEYQYLCPVVNVKNEKAIEVHSIALTNHPTIKGMTPIICSVDKPELISQLRADEIPNEILRMTNLAREDIKKYYRN